MHLRAEFPDRVKLGQAVMIVQKMILDGWAISWTVSAEEDVMEIEFNTIRDSIVLLTLTGRLNNVVLDYVMNQIWESR